MPRARKLPPAAMLSMPPTRWQPALHLAERSQSAGGTVSSAAWRQRWCCGRYSGRRGQSHLAANPHLRAATAASTVQIFQCGTAVAWHGTAARHVCHFGSDRGCAESMFDNLVVRQGWGQPALPRASKRAAHQLCSAHRASGQEPMAGAHAPSTRNPEPETRNRNYKKLNSDI